MSPFCLRSRRSTFPNATAGSKNSLPTYGEAISVRIAAASSRYMVNSVAAAKASVTKTRANGQLTGMRGVFLVAAQLSKLGFIVSPTSRSAAGADLLVTDCQCSTAFSVQVKTNAKSSRYWLVSKHAASMVSPSHIYVLVNLRDNGMDCFVAESATIARHVRVFERKNSTWYGVDRNDLMDHRENWQVFGAP